MHFWGKLLAWFVWYCTFGLSSNGEKEKQNSAQELLESVLSQNNLQKVERAAELAQKILKTESSSFFDVNNRFTCENCGLNEYGLKYIEFESSVRQSKLRSIMNKLFGSNDITMLLLSDSEVEWNGVTETIALAGFKTPSGEIAYAYVNAKPYENTPELIEYKKSRDIPQSEKLFYFYAIHADISFTLAPAQIVVTRKKSSLTKSKTWQEIMYLPPKLTGQQMNDILAITSIMINKFPMVKSGFERSLKSLESS